MVFDNKKIQILKKLFMVCTLSFLQKSMAPKKLEIALPLNACLLFGGSSH
jgi:hypothetical protein